MSKYRSKQAANLNRGIRKFFLSGFVVCTFVAYVIHEQLSKLDSGSNPTVATPALVDNGNSSGSPVNPAPATSPPATTAPALNSSSAPSSTSGSLKNGTFKGPEVDAYYGLVQVQATIQNGKLTDVQFLEYPSDRRTSQEINTIAVPYLQQEALQVQSANVDIISGATLTSEAFRVSLQAALDSAKY